MHSPLLQHPKLLKADPDPPQLDTVHYSTHTQNQVQDCEKKTAEVYIYTRRRYEFPCQKCIAQSPRNDETPFIPTPD